MIVGGHEIPEGFESMSCVYNCGFILVWNILEDVGDVGGIMDTHIAEKHTNKTFPLFYRFLKRGNDDGYGMH
jgi:hypothetical protein